uniref:hypothetical protein n=1 Tax=Nocardia carnea TaxID=37328 RepID=UPI002455DA92
DVLDVPATVAVLPVDRQGRVVLSRRFRTAVDDVVLELPSGVVGGTRLLRGLHVTPGRAGGYTRPRPRPQSGGPPAGSFRELARTV